MRVLVTGAAGFIGYHTAKALLDRGNEVIGLDNLNTYYDVKSEGGPARPASGAPGLHLPQAGPRRPCWHGAAVRRRASTAGHSPRRSGRGSLRDGKPAYLRRRQHRRHAARAGGLSPRRRRASRLCVVELGLRRQHHDALQRASERRPSLEHLRRLQEGERAHGPLLRASLPPAGDGTALLHGVRTVGAARHGVVQVHAQHSRRRADRCVQQRSPRARLHLHRRRGRGGAAHRRPHRAAQPHMGAARTPIRRRRRRPTGSTTSAITSPSR